MIPDIPLVLIGKCLGGIVKPLAWNIVKETDITSTPGAISILQDIYDYIIVNWFCQPITILLSNTLFVLFRDAIQRQHTMTEVNTRRHTRKIVQTHTTIHVHLLRMQNNNAADIPALRE